MIYDISPPLSASLAVWPGDTALRREVACDLAEGSDVTLSALRATVHLGAHADAPGHVLPGGASIDECALERYFGRAQVIRIEAARRTALRPEQVPELQAPRVLFATGTYPDPTIFNEDFAALSVELVEHLHAGGVRLVGIDTPSVDLFLAEDLPAHRNLISHDIAILEGLVLGNVPSGMYELIALPLRLVGFDASPVRAILRPLVG